MSQRNTSLTKNAREFPRKPSLSVHPMKSVQPKVSRIMPREVPPSVVKGDVIPGERMVDPAIWSDIPFLASTLVEKVSLHFLSRVTSMHSQRDRMVMAAVLQHLNVVKEVNIY